MTIPSYRLRKAVEVRLRNQLPKENKTRIVGELIDELAKDRADFAARLLVLEPWAEKARKVLEALQEESPGDFVYDIRERVSDDMDGLESSWDHPRVKSWGEACSAIAELLRAEESDDNSMGRANHTD